MILAMCLAAAAATSAAQEVVEIRFHRVHLRNGNFIDGDLIRITETEALLRVKPGEIGIRRDLIARDETGNLRIEIMKLKGIKETPPIVKEVTPPETTPRSEPSERPPETRSTPPTTAREPAQPVQTGHDALDKILKQVLAAEPAQRHDLMEQIYPLGEPAALALVDALEKLSDEQVRALAADTIARMGEKAVLPAVRRLLSNPDPILRYHGVTIIGSLGGSSSAADLHPMLRDPDTLTRSAALQALKGLDNPASFGPVAALCLDPDSSVRSEAVETLFHLARHPDLEERLEETLSSLLDRARGEALRELISAVGGKGRKEFREIIEKYLADEDPQARARSVEALSALGAEVAADPITERFELETDDPVRRSLAAAAEKLKIRKAIPHLIGWLDEGSEETKAAAYRALRRITGRKLPADHDAWAEWWSGAKPPE